jgi:hypothetical protein
MQKSISKSGMLTRSGFRKRSKSRRYRIGSRSVMRIEYATIDPAPEPRPGPTGMPLSFACRMKSQTMRKYPAKFIFAMTSSSVSRRFVYASRSTSLPCVAISSKRRASPSRAMWRK